MFEQLGKVLLVVGLLVALVGAAMWGLSALGLRKLPGDVLYRGDGVTIFFPIVTCIALSILLTLALWLWQWLNP
jgi:drug/metabolite transporter (DMT)-like permease